MERMTQQVTIDLEPTWQALCRMAERGHLPASELQPACKIADIVRQAQKSGDKSVTFVFQPDGTIEVETE